MGLHPVKIKLLKHLGCLCAPLSFHQESQVSISALSQFCRFGKGLWVALSFLSENPFSQKEAKKGNEKEKERERENQNENKIALLSQIKADLLTACVWFYS